MKRIHLLSLITLLFFACSKDKDDVSPDSKGGTKYRVTFDIDWNSTNFPIDYPSGAHFSKLIGWSHDGSRKSSHDIKREAGLLGDETVTAAAE